MKQTILIVEDDEHIVKALELRLRAKDYGIEVAYDALMGMQKAMGHPPSLILLDITMPGGNGLRLAERLKESSKTMDIPIIFLTASKQADLRQNALSLGATAFFEKPYDFEELHATIKAAILHPNICLTS